MHVYRVGFLVRLSLVSFLRSHAAIDLRESDCSQSKQQMDAQLVSSFKQTGAALAVKAAAEADAALFNATANDKNAEANLLTQERPQACNTRC